jgi:hypothetical protein
MTLEINTSQCSALFGSDVWQQQFQNRIQDQSYAQQILTTAGW